jgi:competence protein ComEA
MRKTKKLFALLLVTVFIVGSVNLTFAQEQQKININTAPVEELIKLKRIGPEYAARIVQYREEQGLFAKPEDIMKVKGIGGKTFEANRDVITVE